MGATGKLHDVLPFPNPKLKGDAIGLSKASHNLRLPVYTFRYFFSKFHDIA